MDFTGRHENVIDHLLAIRPELGRLPSNDFIIESNAARAANVFGYESGLENRYICREAEGDRNEGLSEAWI
jgi:hypothetical protein